MRICSKKIKTLSRIILLDPGCFVNCYAEYVVTMKINLIISVGDKFLNIIAIKYS